MAEDIAPVLLDGIRRDFVENLGGSKRAAELLEAIQSGKAGYAEAGEYAEEVGRALSAAFQSNLTGDRLPDGRMYWNIADRVVRPLLEEDHALVAEAAQQVQQHLNEAAGLGIRAQTVPVDNERINGILNRLASESEYIAVDWILEEPIITFSRSVVDESVRRNMEFQGRSGLRPKIIRRAESHCCAWCSKLAGTYTYPDVPKDVYRRHEHCRCVVEFDPGDGSKRRQNVHTRQWTDPEEDVTLLERRLIGLRVNNVTVRQISDHVRQRMSERSVTIDAIMDAILDPLDIGAVKRDDLGRPSFRVVGAQATVYINPETGTITTTHATHRSLAKKLRTKRGESK